MSQYYSFQFDITVFQRAPKVCIGWRYMEFDNDYFLDGILKNFGFCEIMPSISWSISERLFFIYVTTFIKAFLHVAFVLL